MARLALLLLAGLSLSLLTCPSHASFDVSDYGKSFSGDGTYYGYTPAGNCAMRGTLPSMYSSMVPIAINADQYANSASCGACLVVTGSGRGAGANPISGTFRAYVHDQCPECKRGDLDLSKSGDGRWHLSWKFIPCPDVQPSFLFEGSNAYYKKLQLRGTAYPARGMVIDGVTALRSQDNFYIAHNGGGFRRKARVAIQDIKGNFMTADMSIDVSDGVVLPDSFSGGGGSGGGGRAPRPTPSRSPRPRPPRPARCVPKYKFCGTSRKNVWRSHRCCARKYKCRWVSWSTYKRCAPKHKPRKCIRKGKFCSGPFKKRGRSCCGRSVCRRSRGFAHKRCLRR